MNIIIRFFRQYHCFMLELINQKWNTENNSREEGELKEKISSLPKSTLETVPDSSDNKNICKKIELNPFSYSDIPSSKCKEAVMSRRAYASIIAEAYANGENESGGVLLGHKGDGKWYVVEATDPGFDAYHTPVRHEMNNRYVNYQYRILSRLYSDELYLVGFWHRHPRTFNSFSGLDDKVNESYVKVIGEGAMSFLLNFTPEPVLTCYFMDSDDMCYHKVRLTVDDAELEDKQYLMYASVEEFRMKAEEMQEEMENEKRRA